MPQVFTAEAKAWMEKAINTAVSKQVQEVESRHESRTKALAEKIEPVTVALEKAAKTAASRSGLSPQEVFAKMAGDGADGLPAFGLTADGRFVPFTRRQHGRHTKTIGKRVNEANGHEASFSDFLRHNWEVHAKGIHAASASVEALEKMGAYGVRYGEDERVVKTALAESSGTTGGYGVPPQFLQELMRYSAENQVLGSRARKIPMASRTLTIPSLDHTTVYGAGITPFLAGVQSAWGAESALIAESEPKFRQTELNANQLAVFMIVSNVLMADQVINLDSLVTELLADADGWYSDYAFFQGNGAGKPLGIKNAPATIQVNRSVASHFAFADVPAMRRKLIYTDRGNLIWVIHPSVEADLITLNDGSGTTANTGRVLFIPIDQGVQKPVENDLGRKPIGTLLGSPVYVSEKLSNLGTTGDVMLIDADKYLIGERQDAMIEASPIPYFTTNQTVIRAISRKDGQPWLNGPVTLADGTYTASPFVILN